MIKFNKLFGIGLNKTGTTSLQSALLQLGISTMHDSFALRETIQKERSLGLPVLSTLDYQAYLDEPIDKMYKELDEAYSGSLFICTIRELDSWLDSRERHVRANQANVHYPGNWLVVDRSAWVSEYLSHYAQVVKYFENSSNILWMNICAGDGWEKLCDFLQAPVVESDFPWENRLSLENRL